MTAKLVRADDVDDAAGQEQAREAHGPRAAQPDLDQRDRFVQDVMGREEPWSVRQVPALDRPGLPVVPIARILNRLANSSRSLSVRHVLDRCRQMSYPASADRWSLGARPRLGATAEG